MRGFLIRAVPVCLALFACGCFLLDHDTSNKRAAREYPAAEEYWIAVSGILARKPEADNVPAMLTLVRQQTEQLRALSTEGVDADLVAAVELVIKCEDEVLRRAEIAGNDPETLKTQPALAKSFAEANKQAAEVKKRLRALQPALKARYGGGFAPMER